MANHLRVIDGNGELDDDSAVLPADYATLEELNRKLRREIAALKGQITRLTRVDPQADVVVGLLAYWRATCHGPRSRVEIPLEGKRGDIVRKTLKRFLEADEDPELAHPDKATQAAATETAVARAAERIRTAIDGAAKLPFEGRYGRRYAEPGEDRKRKVELLYILRDEVKLEQFTAIVEAEPERLAFAHDLKRRLDGSAQLRLVLASMNPEYAEILCRAIRYCQRVTAP